MQEMKAEITEVFSSLQGEGLLLGARQIFIRFKRCNLKCSFCDVPSDLASRECAVPQLFEEIKLIDIEKGPHHSISLTGGEPLLEAEYVKELLSLLKTNNFKTYLETNGMLPHELSKVIHLVDIIAMDFKLPSSTGLGDFWEEHLDFLRIAKTRRVFVKMVITAGTTTEDFLKAIDVVSAVDREIPFILQPVTPVRTGEKMPGTERLLELYRIANREQLENTRVIPQIHKVLGVR